VLIPRRQRSLAIGLGEDRLVGELLELGLDPVAAGRQHVVGLRVVGHRQP
jgi:hypothetical protein